MPAVFVSRDLARVVAALSLSIACLPPAQSAEQTVQLRKPAPVAGAKAAADAPGPLYWYDGAQRRALRIDRDWIADFGPAPRAQPSSGAPGTGTRTLEKPGPSPSRPVRSPLQPAGDAEKAQSALSAGASEVLRDEAGSPRALPGGVIVRLRESDRAQARELLAQAGLRPVRSLDPDEHTWLVAAPAGIASLELANRLHESGRFESASPNWWRERTKK